MPLRRRARGVLKVHFESPDPARPRAGPFSDGGRRNRFQTRLVRRVMKIRRLHHVQITMPPGEEAKARVFFSEVVGLREVTKPANLTARGGVWFEVGQSELHLGVEPGFRPAEKAHPAIEVDDLAALRRRLEHAGYDTVEDEPLRGFARFYSRDPFGNRLEFLQASP